MVPVGCLDDHWTGDDHLADWLGTLIIGKSDAGIYFRLSGAILPLLTLSTALTNWLRFQRRATAAVVFTVSTSVLNILLSILFVVVLHQNLEGVYLAQLITAGISTLIAAFLMQDWINPFYFRRARLAEMLRYSIPLIPASIAFWVVNLSSRYFIQAFSTTSEVGLYQLGSNIAMLTALVTNAFQMAWGPFSISIYKQPEARNVYANVFLIYVWITVGLSTALALFAPEVISIFATKEYMGASPVIGILSFSYVLIGLYYIANIGPSIVKDMRPLGVAMIASAILTILLNFLLVPQIGKMGSAIATLISQAIVPIYVFYRAQRLYPIPYRFKAAIGMFLSAALLIACAAMIDVTSIWLSVLIKLGLLSLFIPISFLLRVITVEQVQTVWKNIYKNRQTAN